MKFRTGFMCGIFDLIHAGHIIAFKEAKLNCKYLIVAINSGLNISNTINPGKVPPLFNLDDRKLILENIKLIDEVITYDNEDELVQILKNVQPDIRFLGDDYKGKKITGEVFCKNIMYLDRSHGKSSSFFRQLRQSSKEQSEL